MQPFSNGVHRPLFASCRRIGSVVAAQARGRDGREEGLPSQHASGHRIELGQEGGVAGLGRGDDGNVQRPV